MTILFSNPPWWEAKESRGFLKKKDGEEVSELDLDGHLLIWVDAHLTIQELKIIFLIHFFWDTPQHILQKKLVIMKFFLEIA